LTVPNCLSILMGESLAERIEFVICDAESPKAQVVALKRSGTQNCRMAGRLWREMLFDALANVEPQNGPAVLASFERIHRRGNDFLWIAGSVLLATRRNIGELSGTRTEGRTVAFYSFVPALSIQESLSHVACRSALPRV
jgi:hypothetical protein